MKWITSADIITWAPQRDCQENLPLLIRKLIRADAENISSIRFPAGDNISLGDWDGKLINGIGTVYVPEGLSVWEVGTNKDYKKKAEEDFKKRTAGDFVEDATYVVVTPYVWDKKEKWIVQKKNESAWKDVKVIDGIVLEEWIENYPIVGAWLAKYLEKTPDILPLDDFWENWSSNTEYKISPILVLAGRENESATLERKLQEAPSVVLVKASTIEEVIAFVAATVLKSAMLNKEDIFSRTAIVDDAKQFNSILSKKRHLVLIAKFEDEGLADLAVKNGHHVIVPVGGDNTLQNETIKLSSIRRKGFEEGLQEMGFSREKSEKLVRDSGQSLSVLRRLLQFVKNQQPEWAKNGNHIDLIPAVLVGSWSEDYPEDKEILSRLSGVSYEQYISRLTRWKIYKDSPLLQIGSHWRLTSALDAWSILASFLTRKDFDIFNSVVLDVLNELDPALELAPETRYAALMFGKNSTYSHSLKEGLCKSMVLVAVYGERFNISAVASPQNHINSLVFKVFSEMCGQKWCSLNHYLPLLAEASPEAFIEVISSALSKNQTSILEMFHEAQNPIAAKSYHTGLLWALYSLAISPIYLTQSTLLLGTLADIDPGGSLSNRPLNSLTQIYLPWIKQTQTNFDIRKNALTILRKRHPETATRLFFSLLPNKFQYGFEISSFRWRIFEQEIDYVVSNAEVSMFYDFLLDQLFDLSLSQPKRIVQLIELLDNLDFEQRAKVLEFLHKVKREINGDYYFEIWKGLRDIIAKHQTYSYTSWAFPEDEIESLLLILNLYNPENEIQKNLYLFEDQWIEVVNGPKRGEMEHEEQEQYFLEIRKSAIENIYNTENIEAIFKLTEEVKLAYLVGITLAHIDISEANVNKVLFYISGKTGFEKYHEMAKSYIFEKTVLLGFSWVKTVWNEINGKLNSNQEYANFFLALPQNESTWELLEESDNEISDIYWNKVSPWLYRADENGMIYALQKLMEVGRYVTALTEASHFADVLPVETIKDFLTIAGSKPNTEGSKHLNAYNFERLYKSLLEKEGLSNDEQIQLESMYLSYFTDRHSELKPAGLINELKEKPEFFIELICMLYKPDSEHAEDPGANEEDLAQRQRLAKSAYSLLDVWIEIPGMNERKEMDATVLFEWVKQVRELGENCKRLKFVDFELGKLFASYPRNNDFWPCEEICEIMDTLNSENIFRTFSTEIYNSRGVYSKGLYEGGKQEREISDYFSRMANAISVKFPFTGSVLRQLASHYQQYAKREDEHALFDELR